MKKIALVSLLATSVLFAVAIVMNPQTASGSKKTNAGGPGTALPDSIHKIVQKACMDCHSDDGNFMAKGKINFSAWEKYDSEKQISKAGAMCKVLTKSSMPPKKWRANNPNDVPTQAEIDMVCKWAKGLQK
ncbi:MAG: heme-binding domain-containing protein [Bacteroidetes bacterium]|nr:heme-binding domain-containing protein [Bacteroidota bacterium]